MPHFRNGLIFNESAHLSLNCVGYRQRISAGLDHERHGSISQFRVWPVDHRSDCLIEALEFYVANEANDFTRIVLIFHGDDQSIAQRILVLAWLACSGFIND